MIYYNEKGNEKKNNKLYFLTKTNINTQKLFSFKKLFSMNKSINILIIKTLK